MVPRRPSTSAKLDVVLEEESQIDPAVLETAIANREVLNLRGLDPDDSGLGELERSEIPGGANVIDLRSKEEFHSWHYPDAVRLDFGHALEAYPSFAKDRTYLLYCEFGLKSAHLAELMVRDGLRAYHFRGGIRALRRYCERDCEVDRPSLNSRPPTRASLPGGREVRPDSRGCSRAGTRATPPRPCAPPRTSAESVPLRSDREERRSRRNRRCG